MKPPSKRDQLQALIEAALPMLQLELEKGVKAVDSQVSLLFIKARLEDMARMIKSNNVTKEQCYKGSMGRLVVDTWPLSHPLGAKITSIEYEFYRLP